MASHDPRRHLPPARTRDSDSAGVSALTPPQAPGSFVLGSFVPGSFVPGSRAPAKVLDLQIPPPEINDMLPNSLLKQATVVDYRKNSENNVQYALSPKRLAEGVAGSPRRAQNEITYPQITIQEKQIIDDVGNDDESQGDEQTPVLGQTIKIKQVNNTSNSPFPSPSELGKLEGTISEDVMRQLLNEEKVWDDDLHRKYNDDEHIKYLMNLLNKQYEEWKKSREGQRHLSSDSYNKFNKLFQAIVVNFRAYFKLTYTKMLENMLNLFIQFNKDYGIDIGDIISKQGDEDVDTIRILEEFVVNTLFQTQEGLDARKEKWRQRQGRGATGQNGGRKETVKCKRKKSGGAPFDEIRNKYRKYAKDSLDAIDIMFSYIALDKADKDRYEELKKQLVYFLCLILLDHLTVVEDVEHSTNVYGYKVIDELVIVANTLGRKRGREGERKALLEREKKALKQKNADNIYDFIKDIFLPLWEQIGLLSTVQPHVAWPKEINILDTFTPLFKEINETLVDNLLEYFAGKFTREDIFKILECVYNFIYVNSDSNGNITNRLIRYMIIFALLIFTCVKDTGTYNKQNTLQIITNFNQNFIPQQRPGGGLRTGGKLSKKRNSIKDLEQEVKKLNKKALSLFKKKELVKEKIKKIDTKLKELDKKRKELGKQYKKNKTKTLKNQIDKIIKSIEKEKINKVNKKKELKKISDEYKSKNKELKNKDNALKKKLKKKGGKCGCSSKV